MDLKDYTVVLSSHSPRRAEMLINADIPFLINAIEIDESVPADIHFSSAAEYIAIKKAKEHFGKLKPKTIVIAADTIVVYNGVIYGKPKDKKDAIDTLLTLSNVTHSVYTGVCLYSVDKTVSFTEESKVKFSNINVAEADYYFEKFMPVDKAGSYGIQDWLGYVKVEYIIGSYSNILGLPMAQTYNTLHDFIKSN